MTVVHPNIALINQFFQAYVQGDQNAIAQVLSKDIRWVIPGKHPLSGTKNGIEEVLAYFAQLSKSAFQAEPIVLGVNDQFVIDCHRNWSNRSDGINFKGMSCLLWKIADGKITEVYNFPENQQYVDQFFTAVYSEPKY
ncbi:nuclear transport factor 2 family protein [Cytophagaceae bacterium YF14B1]|uniref:Nuclear transport factor 2 family protein n=1 Tax=Xanthocytophaga flava TaxID=3048013 RepID=A0AAE3QTM6_9BACT|nr:nuclear transport factor 2 family protein [Xanthocytophaga flavus]MDJ1483245.1 nuclear transport factor 2 family protein [Xanthocytophaga flavus]